jgi:SNF2 family DNA or RNA helicase
MNSLRIQPFRIFYSPADDPLNNFYIPALKASVRYDRSAGFFSSTALAVAAEGVAHLIRNGGKMRLLVGAELSEDDVESIRSGYDLREKISEKLLEHFPDPQDALLQKRLEIMAWMVAEGLLEFRVVLPKDANGLPIPASQCQDYYHPKSGVLTDAEGNQVAFSGSVNESETAWLKNYETFMVYFSWDETKPYLAQITLNFERLWAGKEPDWIAIDIPEAVKQRLLKFRPSQAPIKDPFEKEPLKPILKEKEETTAYAISSSQEQRERILFQFLRDAPHLVQENSLGAATSAVIPWPHQTRVADAVLRRFPERAMLCDEVGLGKTIEAGLVIRQLVLSGFVKHCLILAPKSVLRQWQEELYEKFALRVPLYDGTRFWDLYEQPLTTPGGNPWEAFPVMLAGSQLAKRADRRSQILSTHGWDLLVVDEAHHARRKDFKEHIYRPNRLLSLVSELSLRNKITGLLLMTATPMQVHPLEVWDLLKLLGLGARWGADEENFLHYFSELQKSFNQADWDFIFDMLGDELHTGGELDPGFIKQVQSEIGPVKWSTLSALPLQQGHRMATLKSLGDKIQPYVREMARRHTPLRRFVFRNTRTLLREYQRQGILRANVPTRKPKIIRVKMRHEEYALYERIEEYISYFYQKYENERRGLGFIMTVYRRRLTSSFYSVRCSLERRLKFLLGEITPDKAYEDDDLEQEDLSLDLSDELETDARDMFQVEVSYLKDFIRDLRFLTSADSKLERLKEELRQVFKRRPTVLIFTQYTDTMDYLRNQLVEVYGTEIACYSGRGGEIWNGIAWVITTKEFVKNEFKEGRIRIMLCTESASEGLNLQTCGVLINYDMPWNPMRVEQRIGRIDRIGQQFKEVWISNYFYQDTIEDIIYQRLADRINWFEVVVGELQPILAEIGEVTRRLAMLPGGQREAQIEIEITALKQRLQNREVESLNLDKYAQSEEYQPSQPSPVSLVQLENILTAAKATASMFKPDPAIKNAYLLNIIGQTIPVTFSPACFDEHPDTVQFISYGNPILDQLLAMNLSPDIGLNGQLVRFETKGEPELCGWYLKTGNEDQPKIIQTVDELAAHLEGPSLEKISDDDFIHKAETQFQSAVSEVFQHQRDVIKRRRYANFLAEKAKVQRLLVKASLVELALGQQPELVEKETYPSAFNEQAILGLQRHGYPWGALLRLAYEQGLSPHEVDPFFQQIKESARDSLKGRLFQLSEEAKKGVRLLNDASKAFEEMEKG